MILWAERREHRIRVQEVDDMNWMDALKLGCAQTLAMLFPGVSRAGATIIGGLLFALLSVRDGVSWFGAGMHAAFVPAFACVRWFLRYVATHDSSLFAWYRIAFGVVVIASSYMGITWTAPK